MLCLLDSRWTRRWLLAAALLAFAGDAMSEPADEQPGSTDTAQAREDETRREVHLDFVSEPMLRNASFALAGTEAASRALELGAKPLLSGVLDRRGGWGITSRALWALWIDVPLWQLGDTLNHEYGHLARLPSGVTGLSVNLHVGLRASVPILSTEGSVRGAWPRLPANDWLAVQSGGWESDRLFLQRTRGMLYAGKRMHYFDALSYSTSKINTTLYLLRGTRESLIDRPQKEWQNDPMFYARWLSESEEGPAYSQATFRQRVHSLRRGAYWNLADYTLWAATFGWVKGHIVEGQHSLPSPWLTLGPIGLAPAASFTLTPIGAERTLLTGLRIGQRSGDIHVRWSDPLQGRRLVGGGILWRLRPPGTLIESITLDAWRNPSETLGGRIELGGEWRRSDRSRLGFRWSLGAKSRGYLTGFSDSPGVYFGMGLRALF